jgi:hypothetical protein
MDDSGEGAGWRERRKGRKDKKTRLGMRWGTGLPVPLLLFQPAGLVG